MKSTRGLPSTFSRGEREGHLLKVKVVWWSEGNTTEIFILASEYLILRKSREGES